MITKASISSKKRNILLGVTVAIAFLISLPPFFRGMYFDREFLIFGISVFSIFVFWQIYNFKNAEYQLIQHYYEYFLVAVIMMYFLVIPFAANQWGALLEALRYASYFSLYIMVRDLIKIDKIYRETFTLIIFFSLFIISILGIANYMGLLNMKGTLNGNRISSTYQYANSLAAILGAVILFGVSKLLSSPFYKRLIIAGLVTIFTIVFVLTFSRAMWVILPIAFLLMLIILPGGYRVSYIYYSAVTLVPGIIAAGNTIRYFSSKSLIPLLYIAGAAGISMLFCAIYEKLNIRKIVFTNRTLLIAVLILFVTLAASLYIILNTTSPVELACFAEDNKATSFSKTVYSIEGKGDYLLRLDTSASKPETTNEWAGSVRIYSIDSFGQGQLIKIYSLSETYNGLIDIPFSTLDDTYYIRLSFVNYYKDTSFIIRSAAIINPETEETVKNIKLKYKFLPENIRTRIDSINLKEHSLRMRFAFFIDALKVVKRSPIIGMGGKGWSSVYPMFRSFEYWTKEAHSYPIQIWVEIGTAGLLIAIGFIVSYLVELYKNYNLFEEQKQRIEMVGIAGFSFMILAHSSIDFDLSLGAIAVLLWTSFAITGSYFKNSYAVNVRKSNKIKKFTIILTCIFVLFSGSIHIANILTDKAQKALASGDIYSAYGYQSKAVILDYFNSDSRRVFADLIRVNPSIDRSTSNEMAEKQLMKAISFDTYNWRMYAEMAKHMYINGRFKEAIEYVNKSIEYQPSIAGSYIQRIDLLYSIAKKYHEAGNLETAEALLKSAMSTYKSIEEKSREMIMPIKTEPELLNYLFRVNFVLDNLSYKRIFEDAKGIAMYENFFYDTDGNNLPDLWQIPYQDDKIIVGRMAKEDGVEVFSLTSDNPAFYIQRMNLSLEPSSRYLLAIDGYSKSPEGKMMVRIGSRSGKSEQFRDGYFAFNEESGIYQTTFETTDDITQGDQYITLYFNGVKDEVILKRVIIMKMK